MKPSSILGESPSRLPIDLSRSELDEIMELCEESRASLEKYHTNMLRVSQLTGMPEIAAQTFGQAVRIGTELIDALDNAARNSLKGEPS